MEFLDPILYNAKFYLVLFSVLTVMAIITRGRAAIGISKPHIDSALASAGVLYFNMLFGGIFFLGYIGLEKAYTALNVPTLPREMWDHIPFIFTAIILLLVYDICIYWVHRWLHGGWRWPMHAVHHSDTDMNFMTWSRGHGLEQSFIAAAVLLGSSWLGLSITEVAVLASLRAFHQYYVHQNIDWNHGPFKHIIASPQYHRWHHADVREAWDKNFASIFPFLDILWGTHYHPHSAVNVPTGFPDTPKNDLIALILYPFTEWAKMWRARKGSKVEMPDNGDVV